MPQTNPTHPTFDAEFDDLESGSQVVSPGFFPNLVDRLDAALADPSSGPLADLSTRLTRLFSARFKTALPTARAAVQNRDNRADPEAVQAFNLGQLSFAQMFAAQAAEHRGAFDDLGEPVPPANQPVLAPPPHTDSYFAACLGSSYTPTQYGKHEGVHPQRVREAMAALIGTKEADVIAALVFQHELDRQRYERLYAEHIRVGVVYDAAAVEVARLREQMERAAIACAHMEAPAARQILLEALES